MSDQGGDQSNLWKRLTSRQNLPYIIFGLVGIILILGGRLLPADWELARYFSESLGGTLVIATVIIFTVELSQRERQMKASQEITEKISRDVFQAIYHRYIPDSVFKEVEDCLLHSTVYREDYRIECQLDEVSKAIPATHLPEDSRKYFVLSAHNRYKVKNNSKKKITHEVKTYVELPIDARWHDHVCIRGMRINGHEIEDETLRACSKKAEDGAVLCFTYPVQIAGGDEIHVSITYQTIKQKIDMEVWSTQQPTSKLTLQVSAPDGTTVHATANHSKGLEFIRDTLPGSREWSLPHGIFPHQSVIFWWHQA